MKKKRKKKPWKVPQRYLDYVKSCGYGTNINKEAKSLLKNNATVSIVDCDFHGMYWEDYSVALGDTYTRKEIGGWQVQMRPNKKIILACEELLAPATIIRKKLTGVNGDIYEIWAGHIEDQDDIINVFDEEGSL